MTGEHPRRDDAGSIVFVGAGPGIGASVARRFGRAGYAVGLIARQGERLRHLAAEVGAEIGREVATAQADATGPDELRSAIRSVSEVIGEPTVLCFSPIPDIGLIKPVLETGPDELMASLRLNVAGAAPAVESVLPHMRARGTGSLLFTTGSAGLRPSPARAASAVTTTAASVYISLLREALAETGIRVGHTVIVGAIDRGAPGSQDPDDIAVDLWAHHRGEAHEFPTVLRLDD